MPEIKSNNIIHSGFNSNSYFIETFTGKMLLIVESSSYLTLIKFNETNYIEIYLGFNYLTIPQELLSFFSIKVVG